RSAIPAAESYYQDAAAGNGSYSGMTAAKMALQAPGVSPNIQVKVVNLGQGYCIDDTESTTHFAYYVGGTPGTLPTTPAGVKQAAVTGGNVCADFSTWAT